GKRGSPAITAGNVGERDRECVTDALSGALSGLRSANSMCLTARSAPRLPGTVDVQWAAGRPMTPMRLLDAPGRPTPPQARALGKDGVREPGKLRITNRLDPEARQLEESGQSPAIDTVIGDRGRALREGVKIGGGLLVLHICSNPLEYHQEHD